MSSVIYTNKDLQEAVHAIGDHEGTLKIENDDIVLKTKLNETRFDGTFGALRFFGKTFFNTLLVFWVLHHIGVINLLMQFMLIVQVFILVKKI